MATRRRRFVRALFVCLPALAPLRLLADNVSWNVDASGSWTAPANWSSNPALPSSTSDVTIDRPAGDFIITLSGSTQTINSLVDAEQLTIASSGILVVNTTIQVNNLLTLDGTLRNGTLTLGAGGSATVVSGTLDHVTLNSDLTDLNDSLTLINGLTLNSTTLHLIENTSSTAQLTINGTQSISGAGTILFDGTSASGPQISGSNSSSTLTLASGITVKTNTASGLINTGGLVNNGLISAENAGKTLTLSNASFTNNGTIQTKTGGYLLITGNLTAAQLGNYDASGGTIEIGGTLTNTGNTLALNSPAKALTLSGALKGGVLSYTPGNLTLSTTTFDGVTLANDLTISNDTLTVLNGLTLSGTSLVLNQNSGTTQLTIANNATLSGSGTLLFTGTSTAGASITGIATATLTLAPAITTTITTSSATISPSLINQGLLTMQAPGRTLTLSGNSLLNSGTIEATAGSLISISNVVTNSGTLSADAARITMTGSFTNSGLVNANLSTLTLSGPYINNGTLNANASRVTISSNLTSAQLGSYDASTGTITLSGTLTNTAALLALNDPSQRLTLSGTLKGGTLSVVPGILTLTGTSVFDGVTLASDFTLSATSISIANGLTLSNTTLRLTEDTGNTQLSINNNQTLGGAGSLIFDGTSSSGATITGTATLTLAPAITTTVNSSAVISAALINQGTLSMQAAARTLSLSGSSVLNSGLIQVSNGSLITISAPFINNGTLTAAAGRVTISSPITVAQLGSYDASTGTITLSGTLTNTGSILTLNGSSQKLTLSGTLKGGTLTGASAGLTVANNATFDGVALASDFNLTNVNLNIINNLTLNSIVHLLSLGGNTRFSVNDVSTFAGTATFLFDGTANSSSITGTGSLTLAPGISVKTGTNSGTISPPVLINQGLISAETPGTSLTLTQSGSFSNLGQLQAINGGILRITGSLTTAQLGIFNASGGTLLLTSTLDNTNSLLTLNGSGQALTETGAIVGGTITTNNNALALGTTTFDTVTLANSNFSVPDDTLTLLNNFTLSTSTLHLVANTTSTKISVAGTQSIYGNGTILFDGTTGGASIGGTATLTLTPAISVKTGQSSGLINPTTLINQGLISATGSGNTLTLSSPLIVNSGTLDASNNGVLVLTGSSLTIGGVLQASSGGTFRLQGTGVTLTSPISLTNATASFGANIQSIAQVIGTGNSAINVDPAKSVTSDGVSVNTWLINGTHIIRFNGSASGTSQVNILTLAKTGSGTSSVFTSTLNLNNNKLIVNTTDAADKSAKLSSLLTAITAGFAGGTWTGNGITSSTAATNASGYAVGVFDNAILGLATFGGLTVNANALLVALVHSGDANANGIIDIQDQSIITNHWQSAQTNWAAGDLNRDGFVDLQDLTLVTNNWQQSNTLSLTPSTPPLPGSSPIPEPSSLLLALPALLLLKRKPSTTREPRPT